MSVSEIIEAVKKLDEREKGEFLDKLADIDFADAWDRQIEADAASGALDKLYDRVREEEPDINTKPLDELLNDPKFS